MAFADDVQANLEAKLAVQLAFCSGMITRNDPNGLLLPGLQEAGRIQSMIDALAAATA